MAVFPRTVFFIALLGALMLLVSGPGARLGLWEFTTGFQMMRWATFTGFAAVALALVLVLVPSLRRRGAFWWGGALVLGLVSIYVPWQALEQARQVPPIHDITTDTADPPEFVAIRPLRADAPNPVAYPGDEVARQQQEAYPDVRSHYLDQPHAEAFERALRAARSMRWDIVDADPDEGRIEATATTFWYGFKDDVVVRVTPREEGSLIDVRSASRVGRSDAGTNAKRIRIYLDRLTDGG
jgi:uncharacterized protein (DUF1499 family)